MKLSRPCPSFKARKLKRCALLYNIESDATHMCNNIFMDLISFLAEQRSTKWRASGGSRAVGWERVNEDALFAHFYRIIICIQAILTNSLKIAK